MPVCNTCWYGLQCTVARLSSDCQCSKRLWARLANALRMYVAKELCSDHQRLLTLSMMVHSMVLMATGGSLMPSTQLPSQGAGHTLPVNSGKLLVCKRRYSASCHRPLCTRSFHSGIKLPSGQPVHTEPQCASEYYQLHGFGRCEHHKFR